MSSQVARAEHPGRVLVVCTGNVCRSPYIERRLVQLLAGSGVDVVSAGTAALAGEPMDAGSVAQLHRRHSDASGFVARQLTPEIISAADLVLTAAREHRAMVVRSNPKALRYCFTLGDFADLVDGLEFEPVGTAPSEHTRAARVAAVAASRRGLVPPRPADQSDITDPVNRGAAVFAQMATEIERVLPPVARLFQPGGERE